MDADIGHDLGAVIEALLDTYKPVGVGIWLASPNRHLALESPLDWILRGDVGPVLDEAHRLAGGPTRCVVL